MINAPKGTKDVLPQDVYKWQFIEKTARESARTFGISEIRTPVFEHTEVFLRGVGETTDIVNKEMYTFLDKGGRSVTLKPEGTAGVARAFIENGLFNNALPVKLFYISPCFRYERPQAGRLREFHQFGVEVLGSLSAETDAEAIVFAKTFFDKLKVKNLSLKINSIGCKKCRQKYQEALVTYLKANEEKLCPLCRDRMEKNPLRVLDCKDEECKKVTANAPSILDYICEDCSEHFEKVQELLKATNVEFTVDSNIVRGLDYYTRTVFEFVSENIGAQGTICGGGRYDGLIEQLGGNAVPGIGFAMGIERLLLLLENTGVEIPNENKISLYLAPIGEESAKKAFILCQELRNGGLVCETDHMGRGIKSQFKYADKIGAGVVGVIGSTELEGGVVKLKRMSDGTEKTVAFSDIDKTVKELLNI